MPRQSCPHCQASVSTQVQFCPRCGKRLAPAGQAPAQQRSLGLPLYKIIAVVLALLIGYFGWGRIRAILGAFDSRPAPTTFTTSPAATAPIPTSPLHNPATSTPGQTATVLGSPEGADATATAQAAAEQMALAQTSTAVEALAQEATARAQPTAPPPTQPPPPPKPTPTRSPPALFMAIQRTGAGNDPKCINVRIFLPEGYPTTTNGWQLVAEGLGRASRFNQGGYAALCVPGDGQEFTFAILSAGGVRITQGNRGIPARGGENFEAYTK